MSSSPTAPSRTDAQRTRGVSEIRSTIARHVRALIGEDDDAFADELIESFRDTVGELCDRAEAALRADDLQRVAAACHQIKGSAGNVGLARVAHDWHAVEEATLRRDPDLGRILKESLATARHIVAVLEGRPAPPRTGPDRRRADGRAGTAADRRA